MALENRAYSLPYPTAARLRHPPFHRADGRTQHLGDFFVGVFAGSCEEQRVAQLSRKRSDQFANLLLQFIRLQDSVLGALRRRYTLDQVRPVVTSGVARGACRELEPAADRLAPVDCLPPGNRQ